MWSHGAHHVVACPPRPAVKAGTGRTRVETDGEDADFPRNVAPDPEDPKTESNTLAEKVRDDGGINSAVAVVVPEASESRWMHGS